jgi:hypothetical protein
MTLGTSDAAVTVGFIEGLTLDGALGHTGNVLFSPQTFLATSQ